MSVNKMTNYMLCLNKKKADTNTILEIQYMENITMRNKIIMEKDGRAYLTG